jgi:hypothetical protein
VSPQDSKGIILFACAIGHAKMFFSGRKKYLNLLGSVTM